MRVRSAMFLEGFLTIAGQCPSRRFRYGQAEHYIHLAFKVRLQLLAQQ